MVLGAVDAADAILILRMERGLQTPTDYQRSVGDVNGDGRIDPADATTLLRESIGALDVSPLE